MIRFRRARGSKVRHAVVSVWRPDRWVWPQTEDLFSKRNLYPAPPGSWVLWWNNDSGTSCVGSNSASLYPRSYSTDSSWWCRNRCRTTWAACPTPRLSPERSAARRNTVAWNRPWAGCSEALCRSVLNCFRLGNAPPRQVQGWSACWSSVRPRASPERCACPRRSSADR